ncbi:hypothetical protein [Halobacillus naozhouensis]|uniref:Uncharacterized protein n=1 Tax=Halobacillus naozhouensis TaxID=554880 RepID=A0ABY8J4J8_9BACI|nr:hypothetical protein [Halobacillus naozhouensis]WFT75680.1 hypothetical protein P9989_04635 [Halobacillus naozhouensis]
MINTVLLALLSFILVSGLLVLIGFMYDIKLLMFSYYEETSSGFVAGSSVIPFIIGGFCSYVVRSYYQKKIVR